MMRTEIIFEHEVAGTSIKFHDTEIPRKGERIEIYDPGQNSMHGYVHRVEWKYAPGLCTARVVVRY